MNRTIRHRITGMRCVAIASALVLAFAACGGDDGDADGQEEGADEQGEDADEPSEPVDLVFTSWFVDAELEAADQLIADFEEANPHISVDHQVIPWDGYPTTLQTRLAGGETPDVMFLSQLWYQGFAELGALAELDSAASADAEFDVADFNPELLESGRYDGQLYWLPYGLDMQVLFYNADMFAEAGLDVPDETWTWEDLRSAAAELTVDENDDGRIDQYGLIAQNDFASGWNWIWQNGGQVLNDERTGGEMSSPATVEALSFFEAMMNEDQSIPNPEVISDLGYTTAFTGENAAMGIYGHYLVPALENDATFEWGTTVLPSGPANRNSFASGAGYTMSAQTEHPEEAWRFISHMTGVEGLRAFMDLGSITPPRTSLYESEEFLSREASEAFAAQAEHLTPVPIAPEWNEYFEVITEELDAVYRGEVSLEEATATIDQRLGEILGG